MSYDYITSNGTVIVDTATIKAEVIAEYKIIFGLGVSDTIDPATEEGRLVDSDINSRVSAARNNALLANQSNPNLSESTFFDATYALLGGERDAAEQSTCDCLLAGVSGTIIAAGSFAEDDNGELWSLVVATEIPVGGSITTSFKSVNYGVISAEIGEINTISSGVVGWETITNEVAAVEGKLEQTVISAKKQRRVEIGLNSRSNASSVIAAINVLEGVAGVSFRENRLNIAQVIDGINMPANSTWVCVDGGAISDISAAYVINTHGTQFFGFNNTVVGTYTDPYSDQVFDDVSIDRPTDIPLLIQVTARTVTTTDVINSIKAAVIAWSDSLVEGYDGCVLANVISPFEIAAALNQYFGASSIYVQSVKVSTVAAASLDFDPIDTELWERCSITEANISVVSL